MVDYLRKLQMEPTPSPSLERLVRNSSPSKPFIFDIDGRTLEFSREDFYLITSFWFGKVNLDSKEEDHSEFYKRVFPKIDNLKGEHLLAPVNKDVKLNKLDDEDAIHVCFLLALDFIFMGHELRHTEVHHEVHVHTKLSRVVDKEEVHVLAVDKEYVHTQSVDEEDKKKRVVLEKTVKAQEQMIVDLQRRLLSLEEITKQLKTGPSDVDHHDKTDNRSENVLVGGFDHQSMEGVSQCMNVDEPCTNWDDALDNFHVDGLDHQSVEGVRELFNDNFDKPLIGLDSVQDACVSELINADQPSLVNMSFTFSCFSNVVKDVDENDVKTVEAMASPYLSEMLLWFKYSLYYIDSVKYGVPWFANNVEKVYFPINEKDSHQVLEELHIISGLITIYDSLGGPPGGIETRHFWLELREKL
nr:phospholipase-like protein [Tanacetum cinerariifolium]